MPARHRISWTDATFDEPSETAALQQRFEPGIGAVRVPLGIDRQIYQVDVVNVEGPVEPFEDQVAFTQAGVDQRHRVRRHETLA